MAQRLNASKQRCWLNLMRLWQKSQLSVREFCHRHQLNEPSFYSWRRTLLQRGLIRPLRPPAPAASATPPKLPTFVPLAVESEPPSPTPIELVLQERCVLRIRPGFDPALLRQLVQLLQEDLQC